MPIKIKIHWSFILKSFKFFTFLIFCIFAFQGCESSISTDFTGSTDLNSEGKSFDSSFPFPFDTQINQIAYMSCHGMAAGSFNKQAYFTIKAGAYDLLYSTGKQSGGMRFSDDFLSLHKEKTNDRKVDLLSESSLTSSLKLQFGIHNRLSFGTRKLSAESEEKMVDTPLSSLSNDTILRRLSKLSIESNYKARANYFFNSKGSKTNRYVQGSIYANTYEQLNSIFFRNELLSDSLLTLGYTTSDLGGHLVTLSGEGAGENSKPLALGFSLGFNYGKTFGKDLYQLRTRGGIYDDKRVLTRVNEFELGPGDKTGAKWGCKEEHQFMIVRESDLKNFTCDSKSCPKAIYSQTDFESLSSSQKAILEVLRPEDWYVSFKYQYAVPRKSGGACYGIGSLTNIKKVNVNYSGADNNILNFNKSDCGPHVQNLVDNSVTLCPHYISFCTRGDPF